MTVYTCYEILDVPYNKANNELKQLYSESCPYDEQLNDRISKKSLELDCMSYVDTSLPDVTHSSTVSMLAQDTVNSCVTKSLEPFISHYSEIMKQELNTFIEKLKTEVIIELDTKTDIMLKELTKYVKDDKLRSRYFTVSDYYGYHLMTVDGIYVDLDIIDYSLLNHMLVEQNTLINSDSNITKLKQSMNDDSNQMLPYIELLPAIIKSINIY